MDYQTDEHGGLTMNDNYYLVTVTVTYRVEDVVSSDEAVSIMKHQLLPAPHLDGVLLEDIVDGFWSEVLETEEGIECVSSGEFGQQS